MDMSVVFVEPAGGSGRWESVRDGRPFSTLMYKVSIETRQIFLQEVRDRNTHPPPKKQKKIMASFETIEIEN